MAQTFGGTAPSTAPPSLFPPDGARLDRLDKFISSPLFRLQLGLPLEVVLSVPGCFFGMPSILAVLPSVVAGACTTSSLHGLHTRLSALIGLLILVAWGYVLAGSERVALRLFSLRACVIGPLVGVWLVEANPEFGGAARARAHLMLTSWFAALVPTLVLKKFSRRRRPIVSAAATLGEATVAAAGQKRLRIIPKLLSRDSNAALPSGDAVGALIFAYALGSCGYRRCALACALSSCTARIYWHAHHVLDVALGATIALGTSAALELALGDAACWWHALLAEVLLTTVAVLCGTHNNAHKKPKGR